MTEQELIARVREEARGLDPNMRGMIMTLTDRLEMTLMALDEKKLCQKTVGAGRKAEPEPGRLVHILGSVWTIKQRSESEDENLKDCDGYCDWTTREIVVEREESGNLADMERYIRKVIRHEIIHAFLFESGLCQCSCTVQNWAMNEEMVDWLAHQGQQIYAAWKEAGALDV